MTYTLEAELKISKNGLVENNHYQSILIVNELERKEENSVFYNKELKIYIEKEASVNTLYEIELYDICLRLSEDLEKANDFTRRLMLRYDYIQPKVNTQGKVVSVQNTKELQDVWQSLKENILEDYEGDAVTDYLKEVEEKMLTQDFILSPMSQYFFFGLLFPGIPASHSMEWKSTRDIEFSDYEEEKFQEFVSFDKEIDNLRLYRISGNTLPNSNFVLEDFSGLIRVKKGEILPVQSDITIIYKRHGQQYQWIFNLEQY